MHRLVPDTTLNRRRIFQQLREVEVFTAPKVVQNWSILHRGNEIIGNPQAGRVAMTANDEGLKIYFANGALGTARCKWEFTALIADFCGISNDPDSKSDAKSLLMLILNEGQVGEINEILDTNSVPPLVTDDDLEDAEQRASDSKSTLRKKGMVTAEFVNPFAHLSGQYNQAIAILHMLTPPRKHSNPNPCLYSWRPSTTRRLPPAGNLTSLSRCLFLPPPPQCPRPTSALTLLLQTVPLVVHLHTKRMAARRRR
jgi:hypothetical protein